MSTEKNNTRRDADHGPIADHQPETAQKLPYEAPRLISRAKLPVITAGSISKQSWRFDEVEDESNDPA